MKYVIWSICVVNMHNTDKNKINFIIPMYMNIIPMCITDKQAGTKKTNALAQKCAIYNDIKYVLCL